MTNSIIVILYRVTILVFSQMPSTSEDWTSIAHGYDKRWNFPNCVGSIDGKHVHLVAPPESGSMFYNYKGRFSIVLLAIVDFDYNFIYADVGCQGWISDGGVFKFTSFCEKLENDQLNLPKPRPLAEGRSPVPYGLIADDAFALSNNIMKPYKGCLDSLTPERIYNYRVSRARRMVENVFGILAAKFRVFLTTIALHPDKVESVTLACVYLHNFFRRDSKSRSNYNPPGSFDNEDIEGRVVILGSWRADIDEEMLGLQVLPRKPLNAASKIREEFRDFFNSTEGAVPWQYGYS